MIGPQPQSLACDFADDEIDALRAWRSAVARRIEQMSARKKRADRDGNAGLSRWLRGEIGAEQRLEKAILLFWAWLAGVGVARPFGDWPIELSSEISRVDGVLQYGVAPGNLASWFDGERP